MTAAERLDEASALIRAGKLVAFPTETVYGLGANALDADAVRRIFVAKGRPLTSPLIVHVDSPGTARGLVLRWPADAENLAAKYWPGPLTLVLPKDARIPDIVTAGLPTVGLRVPAHPLALELIRRAGVPVAAPSANRFGQLSPTTAEHVRKSMGDAVDLILDGGSTGVGIESVVLSLAGDRPVLLRPGVIPVTELEALIGPVESAPHVTTEAHASPGMHARHYRPITPLMLLAAASAPPPGHGAWLWFGRDPHQGYGVTMPNDPAQYASMLYDVLHRLDEQGLDWIAVERPPGTPEWAGVLDRLERAAV